MNETYITDLQNSYIMIKICGLVSYKIHNTNMIDKFISLEDRQANK